MADDIKAMTAELARDPASLIFLELGEALRTRGQTDAAARIAASGVVRHPDLAATHDLYARVLVDLGDFERAYHEWTVALELEPRHYGAHKGLGFLSYRWGDLDGAVEHLELALAVDPTDPTITQAIERVREGVTVPHAPVEEEAPLPVEESPVPPVIAAEEEHPEPSHPSDDQSPWASLEGGGGQGVLLVDHRGLLLSGGLTNPQGEDVGEAVAAYLTGVAEEAGRTTRLLDLGAWHSVLVEGQMANMLLARPTEQTVLLLTRDRTVPQGRLGVLADRACRSAHTWLEEQHL
jgi:tetratricopeptide (TPR) repeat protein